MCVGRRGCLRLVCCTGRVWGGGAVVSVCGEEGLSKVGLLYWACLGGRCCSECVWGGGAV